MKNTSRQPYKVESEQQNQWQKFIFIRGKLDTEAFDSLIDFAKIWAVSKLRKGI